MNKRKCITTVKRIFSCDRSEAEAKIQKVQKALNTKSYVEATLFIVETTSIKTGIEEVFF